MKTVNCSEMLTKAIAGGYAVPQFNVSGLEWTKGILEVCEELRSPVILGVAMKAAEAMAGYQTVTNMVEGMLEDMHITVPVALHLDHGSYDACLACLDAGFSSVMFDGSKLPFEENVKKVEDLVERCRAAGVSLEAEVGTIGAYSGGAVSSGECADPAECEKMAQLGVTMLAAGIGNIHGIYPADWQGLNWDVLTAIKQRVGALPLVLHGGSGIPAEMLRQAITLGVGKININTECQIAFMKGVRQYFEEDRDRMEKGYFVRTMLAAGVEQMKPVLREKIRLFGCAGKA